MFKLLKNKNLMKFICFILICAFTVNLAGCSDENNVPSGQVGGGNANHVVGIGNNVTGYSVYSQSTFDPMSEELYMGYLLSGRSFTLIVVPGRETGDDDFPYEIRSPEHNYLYTSAQNGVYQYNELTESYENPESKLLMYYVTDVEFVEWLNNAESNDNFLANAIEFASSDVDIEKPSRYKCANLVNMGKGLNATDFCGTYSEQQETLQGGIITNSNIFSNAITGGMVLFFDNGSIEGYMTYEHINGYKGSKAANSFDSSDCTYRTGNVGKYNYSQIAELVKKDLIDEGLYGEDDFKNIEGNSDLKEDLISKYVEYVLMPLKGCDMLKATYRLIEQALLTDYNSFNYNSFNVNDVATIATNGKNNATSDEERDEWTAVLSIINMLNNFDNAKKEEQFNIKMSASLYGRYDVVKSISNIEVLSSGKMISNVQDVSYNQIKNLINNTQDTTDDYLVLVTADGFIFDRGSEEDQITLGASDMLGFSSMMQEVVRMDACPNGTIAAEMFNLLANLKIYAGAGLAVGGIAIGIGVTVAFVIAKAAAIATLTPIPGARIVALALAAIAAATALVVGLVTFVSGMMDKARLKGMGASDTDYCKTYAATFKWLFETLTLNIPIYHYEIPKSNVSDKDDAINAVFCAIGTYEETTQKCKKYDEETKAVIGIYEPTYIPMYYYANRQQAEELKLEGMPILMHFKDGKMIDSIYGASTPAFIIEALRFWGLLAMRELVYSSQVSDNKVSIKHTTNTNARTMYIEEARYCYTTEYESNLYSENNRGLCFNSSSNPGFITKTLGKNWNGNASEEIFSIDISNKKDVEDKLQSLYDTDQLLGYFSELSAYQYNDIKNEMFSSVDSELVGTQLDSFNFAVAGEIKNGDTVTANYVQSGKTMALTGTYYSSGDKICIISGSDVYLFKVNGQTYTSYGNVATFNSGKSEKDLITKLEAYKVEFADFIDFVVGEVEFEEEEKEITVKLYMTATIKESPQANYYYEDNEKKYCDSGEYVYYRSHVFGWVTKNKCLEDGDVSSKDTAKSTIDVGESENDVLYNYYSTSAHVANVKIVIAKNGNIELGVEWLD